MPLAITESPSPQLGVDVEPAPAEGTMAQVVPLLHPAERARVEAAEAGARAGVFATLWARKEAYLKGLGTGPGRDLAADVTRPPPFLSGP
ncbi:4'-phosphopantetheinyl transferase superfamily protein [Streptomyces atratus]|uniref:4'-phosphopantetheinyl transferase superfamily protein n=1 Tax=Streptomyces atratus TaxID=1893 RepID=UPI002AC34792|nr:4'-phosphopantetheinyl transferase superfamily protein [Streptomyces atratus]WPW26106.1 4'-phosphopantetheinyl transferase superfamily protein [Streptomyces atratus]